MMEIKKDEYRLSVLKRIEEYEAKGLFDSDVENDPPWTPLDPKKIDFTGKKLSSKIKTFVANILGANYFNRQMRKKAVILEDVKGLENLAGFTGGAMVTCNHINPFDSYAAYLSLKRHFTDRKFKLYKIVREGNYSIKGLLGFIVRNCNTLPVSEKGSPSLRLTAECMKGIEQLLKQGKKIMVYAEQSMWWNYRKPRPLKKGAFLFAAKFNAPLIPCFFTMSDSDIVGADGFPVQKYTFNILPIIYPDPALSVTENCEMMRNKNYALWKEVYESTYGEKLSYTTAEASEQ